jgi:RNA polymerase sigma factor (sigma-70 family)
MTLALTGLALAFLLTVAGVPSNADDVALLKAALGGRMSARNQLVTRLAPVVRARLRRALSNWPNQRIGAHDLDDLTHLTWCRLLENDQARLRAYDPATGVSVVAYVSMVTQQLFLNVLEQHRAAKRAATGTVDVDEAYDLASPTDTPAAMDARGDLARVWTHLMAELPERGRAVLALLYADGLDVDGAAAALGVQKQVVYNWQFKIRQLTRGFLEGAA